VRTWPGLAAIGAGLIHLGSAAGAPVAVLVPLAAVGVVELLLGVLVLARDEALLARAGLGAVAGVLVLSAVAILLPPAAARRGAVVDLGVPAAAFAGAAALDLAVAVLLVLRVTGGFPRRQGGAVGFLVATAAAAAVVAVVTTQSLAVTAVGGGPPMTMH